MIFVFFLIFILLTVDGTEMGGEMDAKFCIIKCTWLMKVWPENQFPAGCPDEDRLET